MKLSKILIVALAITATQAFAGMMTQTQMPAPVGEPSYFDGLYVGVGAGLVKPNAEMSNDVIVLEPRADEPEMFKLNSDDSGKYGFGASIFAGFGKVFDFTTYLGAEIFGNYFEPDMKLSTSITTYEYSEFLITKIKIENDYSFGILARAGYLFSPKIMFYVLFGIEESEFDVKESFTFFGTTLQDKFDKHEIGYLPGIGMETVIADQITLKMQYVHAFYSSFKYATTKKFNFNGGLLLTADHTIKVDPSRGMLSLMLSWYVV